MFVISLEPIFINIFNFVFCNSPAHLCFHVSIFCKCTSCKSRNEFHIISVTMIEPVERCNIDTRTCLLKLSDVHTICLHIEFIVIIKFIFIKLLTILFSPSIINDLKFSLCYVWLIILLDNLV